MGTKKGKDEHKLEPKLNNGGITETSSESFNTLISHLVQNSSSRRDGAVGGLIANNAQKNEPGGFAERPKARRQRRNDELGLVQQF